MKTGLILFGLAAILYYLYRENHLLQITRYAIRIPGTRRTLSGLKIIQLNDFHLPNGGASIDDILEKAKKEAPQLIFLTGDLVHAGAKEFPTLELTHLAKGLSAIAPVYAITGNHDVGTGELQKWKDILTSAQVRVLLNEAEWIPFGEEGFLLMGLSEEEELHPPTGSFLKRIVLPEGKESLPKVLLAHHPEFFEEYVKDEKKCPALTFSGHAHGGQFILPFVGGLFAPGQGALPFYDYGIYPSESHPDSRMVLSRGTGNSTFPLRINNRPEMVVVTLE